MVRQLKKAVFFHQTSGITTKFGKDIETNCHNETKRPKLRIVFFAFEIRLPTAIKNVTSACKKWTRLACARVRCFPFFAFTLHLHVLPPDWQAIAGEGKDRFCLHPLWLTFPHSTRKRKKRTKTRKRSGLWSKTCQLSCQNPQQSKRLPRSGEGKGEHRPSPFPSPHQFDLLYLIQVGEGWRQKTKNCGVRTRSRARGNVRFDKSRQSFEKYCCPVKV